MNPKLQQIRKHAQASFPERSSVVDGSLSAMLAGEHVLIIGPPGTAKSAIARYLSKGIGAAYFERLMTKFSTPEELFGPPSLKGLENDKFMRITTGKLPEAEIAFVDEVFKSNSAILNSLLTVMNERLFHNDGAVVRCPLVTLFGASNELPEGRELEALFDRFLVRYSVDYLVRASNFRAVITSPVAVAPPAALTMAELQQEQVDAAQVKVGTDTIDAIVQVRDQLKAEGLVASDRRWKQSVRLIQASAYLDGGIETCPEDLQLLADVLWRDPKDRAVIAKVLGKVADPAAAQALEIVDAARELVTKLQEKAKGSSADYVGAAAKAMATMKDQLKKLRKVKLSAGRRATKTIGEAEAEINGFQQDLMAIVTQGYGLTSEPAEPKE